MWLAPVARNSCFRTFQLQIFNEREREGKCGRRLLKGWMKTIYIYVSICLFILVSGLVHIAYCCARCCIRCVYVGDGNVNPGVLGPVLARSEGTIHIHPSCCVRSLMLKIHLHREISQRVKQEVKRLTTSAFHPHDACLWPDNLEEYKSLLFQKKKHGKGVVGKIIFASDLVCLACNNWLNLATIQSFEDLCIDQSTETAIFVLNHLIGLNKKQHQALAYSLHEVNYIMFIGY